MTVPTKLLSVVGWHRLIPSKYSAEGGDGPRPDVRSHVNPEDAEHLSRLAGATNEGVQAERRGLAGILAAELLFGVPHANIVNDAFCHTGIAGHRFNDTTRGAWYASDCIETSLVEVASHKARNLADLVVASSAHGRPDSEVGLYDDWLADFRMLVHSMEFADKYTEFLQPDPIPECYVSSQLLATQLFSRENSNGILYPSVRRKLGMCLACFRPGLVNSPRRVMRIQITFESIKEGYKVTTVEIPCSPDTETH